MKNNLIYRCTHNRENLSWLKVTETKIIESTEDKKFFKHGNLVDTASGGNGYHGRCEHCGLALVTDLGYNSWANTKCEIKAEKKVTINIKFRWMKDRTKATLLDEKTAHKHQSSLISEQGWGTYNFLVSNRTDIE